MSFDRGGRDEFSGTSRVSKFAPGVELWAKNAFRTTQRRLETSTGRISAWSAPISELERQKGISSASSVDRCTVFRRNRNFSIFGYCSLPKNRTIVNCEDTPSSDMSFERGGRDEFNGTTRVSKFDSGAELWPYKEHFSHLTPERPLAPPNLANSSSRHDS